MSFEYIQYLRQESLIEAGAGTNIYVFIEIKYLIKIPSNVDLAVTNLYSTL